jgi:hypothetical protein
MRKRRNLNGEIEYNEDTAYQRMENRHKDEENSLVQRFS